MDGPGTANGFPNMSNRGDVNKNWTTDDMNWSAMGQEEVQGQKNDAEEIYICPIDILLCYWKSSNGKMMMWINGLDGLFEDTVEANDVKIDYPDTLAIYLIGTSIGVKKSWNYRNLRVAKEWCEWAVRFTNAKTRRIERVFMILGNDLMEDVFGCQVTMSMLRPLRYH